MMSGTLVFALIATTFITIEVSEFYFIMYCVLETLKNMLL